MKDFNLLVVSLVLCAFNYAQTVNLEWVNSLGGTSGDAGYSVVTEKPTGYIYVAGAFSGIADFDPSSSLFTITSNGNSDVYVQKLDASENLIWAISFGGTLADNARSITLDSIGNIYITGRYQGSVDFDPSSSTYYLTSNGNYDLFIMKLDSGGNFNWARSIGGVGQDQAQSITVDINGNIYLTGMFQDTVDFNPGASVFNLSSKGYGDIFVLKLDGGGNFIWAKAIGGKDAEIGWSVVTEGMDAVYISGFFRDTVDFDPGTADFNLISNFSSDAFVMKLDGSGNFLWANSLSGTNISNSSSIVTESNGYIFVAGSFSGTADFDPGAATLNITSQGSYDIYVQKLKPNGELMWAKTMGGLFDDEGLQITTDDSSNVYVTGVFSGSADFDPDTSSHFLMSVGTWDTYVLKLDSSGKFKNAGSVGGSGNDFGFSISTEPNEYAQYVTGNFAGTADFDPSSSTHNLTSNGGTDIFNLKLSACGQVKGIHEIEACDSYTWVNGITYTADNNSATYTSTNAKGCDSVSTLNLTLNTVDATVAVSDSIITANDSGAIYQWLDCKNNYAPLSGDTGQSFTAKLNGEYAVVVTKNSCSDTSDCIVITSIGIENFSSENTVSIYPVPASGKLNIEYSGSDKISTILIFNLMGEKMLEMYGREMKLDVSDLASGIYSIRIQFSKENQYQTKFVKN